MGQKSDLAPAQNNYNVQERVLLGPQTQRWGRGDVFSPDFKHCFKLCPKTPHKGGVHHSGSLLWGVPTEAPRKNFPEENSLQQEVSEK